MGETVSEAANTAPPLPSQTVSEFSTVRPSLTLSRRVADVSGWSSGLRNPRYLPMISSLR